MSQPLYIRKSRLLKQVVSILTMTIIPFGFESENAQSNMKLKINKPQKRMGMMEQLIKTKNSKIFHFVIIPIHSSWSRRRQGNLLRTIKRQYHHLTKKEWNVEKRGPGYSSIRIQDRGRYGFSRDWHNRE